MTVDPMNRLWLALAAVLAISFAVLGWAGVRIYQMAPPVPDRVVSQSGQVVFDSGTVQAGQNVWRALGGMEVGSVWGHGAYVAPDWTADWLHREATAVATAVIAFLFVRLGLVGAALAGRATVLAATIFLSGGVIGTLHHLYFSGTPTSVLALGAVFSALEVVPLVFLGKDAWDNWQLSSKTAWMHSYRWPVFFFIGVAFWNLIGAGLFGFMINPPIALYYMQGLNTTPVHGHTALFGVYGLLGMGLVLFAVRAARPQIEHTTFAIGTFAFVLAILRATIGRRGVVELSPPPS